MVKKIDETLNNFLEENKMILEKTQLRFKNDEKINELMRYVQEIKENVLNFVSKDYYH